MKMTTEEAFVKVLQMHGIEHAFGIPPKDGFLLLVQTGQQFTILLQLHPQRFDEIMDGWIHGR